MGAASFLASFEDFNPASFRMSSKDVTPTLFSVSFEDFNPASFRIFSEDITPTLFSASFEDFGPTSFRISSEDITLTLFSTSFEDFSPASFLMSFECTEFITFRTLPDCTDSSSISSVKTVGHPEKTSLLSDKFPLPFSARRTCDLSTSFTPSSSETM